MNTAVQLTMFILPDPELPPADESLEAILQDWDVLSDGTLVQRHPSPFTRDWYIQQQESER